MAARSHPRTYPRARSAGPQVLVCAIVGVSRRIGQKCARIRFVRHTLHMVERLTLTRCVHYRSLMRRVSSPTRQALPALSPTAAARTCATSSGSFVSYVLCLHACVWRAHKRERFWLSRDVFATDTVAVECMYVSMHIRVTRVLVNVCGHSSRLGERSLASAEFSDMQHLRQHVPHARLPSAQWHTCSICRHPQHGKMHENTSNDHNLRSALTCSGVCMCALIYVGQLDFCMLLICFV